MRFLTQLIVLAHAAWPCMVYAETVPSPTTSPASPSACVLHADDANSVLLFAVGTHGTDIANHVGECQGLGLSESNTVEGHLDHWQNGIQPAVTSMKELVGYLARLDHLAPWHQEMVQRIHPHVVNIERRTDAAMRLLAGSTEGHLDRSYAEILSAVLEDADYIVLAVAELWQCGEMGADRHSWTVPGLSLVGRR